MDHRSAPILQSWAELVEIFGPAPAREINLYKILQKKTQYFFEVKI
jgi:hypothetical protein